MIGSAYSIRRYEVDGRLGGRAGLAAARAALAARGVKLLVDFVPNHVAPDHPWLSTHPEYFVRGDAADLAAAPDEFLAVGDSVIARGRDPYFPPWPDVAQLDAFAPGLRRAAVDTLIEIGDVADGVRCDMAMLMLNDVFQRTWGERAGPPPATEYWSDVITAARARHPELLFMAEAYWDLEARLQELGFDYCYDKRLYDRLLHADAADVRGHLGADIGYQRRLVRFVENHDEPRVASELSAAAERSAAVVIATLPGATLWHEGQFEGWRIHVPVLLGRRPPEPVDEERRSFHHHLVAVAHDLRRGEWTLCDGHRLAGQRDVRAAVGVVLDRRGRSARSSSSTTPTPRRPPWCTCRGPTSPGARGASTTSSAGRATNERATTSRSQGSTSASTPGRSTSCTGPPSRSEIGLHRDTTGRSGHPGSRYRDCG